MNKSLTVVPPQKLGKTELRIMKIWMDSGENRHDKIVHIYNNEYRADGEKKINLHNVHNAIRKIKRLYLQEHADDIKEMIIDEYFVLYNEALSSWMNSKEDEVIVTEIREETDKGFKESVSERRKPQTGDPRHLGNAARMLESLRQIQGIDAPKKIEHILKQEMILVMEYLHSALQPETFEEVKDSLKNYGTENMDVIDIDVEEI